MSAERVKVILHESWYPRELSDLVAQRTGATVLVVPQTPGAVKGTDDYIAHLDYLIAAVAGAPPERGLPRPPLVSKRPLLQRRQGGGRTPPLNLLVATATTLGGGAAGKTPAPQ